MNEQQRIQSLRTAGPGGLTSIFADDEEAGLSVEISTPHFRGRLPLANSSVGEIRARFRDRYAIDPHSQAFVDGHPVGEETVVRAGQTLMYIRQSGEKGCSHSVA